MNKKLIVLAGLILVSASLNCKRRLSGYRIPSSARGNLGEDHEAVTGTTTGGLTGSAQHAIPQQTSWLHQTDTSHIYAEIATYVTPKEMRVIKTEETKFVKSLKKMYKNKQLKNLKGLYYKTSQADKFKLGASYVPSVLDLVILAKNLNKQTLAEFDHACQLHLHKLITLLHDLDMNPFYVTFVKKLITAWYAEIVKVVTNILAKTKNTILNGHLTTFALAINKGIASVYKNYNIVIPAIVIKNTGVTVQGFSLNFNHVPNVDHDLTLDGHKIAPYL
ncbi:hypothetical protein HN446_02885 [bacterium]|jgi:hypothetical protein|nr:hypothetical protein [bacterium]